VARLDALILVKWAGFCWGNNVRPAEYAGRLGQAR
jgi:hypothetical protein